MRMQDEQVNHYKHISRSNQDQNFRLMAAS